eukprot:3374446-Prymnesium_polylepis.2
MPAPLRIKARSARGSLEGTDRSIDERLADECTSYSAMASWAKTPVIVHTSDQVCSGVQECRRRPRKPVRGTAPTGSSYGTAR